MNDDLMEYMVRQKRTAGQLLIQLLCIVLLSFFVASIVFIRSIGLALAVIWGWVMYKFIYPATNLEYEYLYCDKTITVDKIMGQKKRKNIGEYTLDRMEMMAPLNSPRWSEYRNKDLKVYSYWSLRDSKMHKPYAFVYGGGQKIILDLPAEFVKIVQNNAPRKVFFD